MRLKSRCERFQIIVWLDTSNKGRRVTGRRQKPRMVVTGPPRPTVPFAIAFAIAICSLFLLIVRLAEHPDPVKSIILLGLACAPIAFFRVHLKHSADD
jgi:hypothetical protein